MNAGDAPMERPRLLKCELGFRGAVSEPVVLRENR